MVFADLSNNSSDPFSNHRVEKFPIAGIQDRVLATFLDVALFSPLFSLLLSQLYKKIEVRYYTEPSSTEFFTFVVLAVFVMAALTICAQTLFLTMWQATPGMKFLKLRLVSTASDSAPRFSQAFLRSFLWVSQCFLFGIPFLEVLGHSHRRGVHDRAAETMLVTTKAKGDTGPHPLESQFVRNLTLAVVGCVCLWFGVAALKIYRTASQGEFKRAELEKSDYLCHSISHLNPNPVSRLDFTIAQFISNEIEDDCLLSESDFALWTNQPEQKSWAYLAKSFYYGFDQKKSDEYLELVCPDDGEKIDEACRIARGLQSADHKELSRDSFSFTGKIIQIRELVGQSNFSAALSKVQSIAHINPGFAQYAQKQTVKLLWSTDKQDQAMGAYMNAWPFLDDGDQVDLAAWMCLEQVDQSCENRTYKGCENLRQALQKQSYGSVPVQAVIGVVEENECKHTHNPVLLTFNTALEENPELKEYALALSSDSGWNTQRRMSVFKKLSSKKNVSGFLQKRALYSYLKKADSAHDFEQIRHSLADSDRKDWTWKKTSQMLERRAPGTPDRRLPASSDEDAP